MLYEPVLHWNSREQFILDHRINATKKMTLRAIGYKFDVLSERIRQVEAQICTRLRYNKLIKNVQEVIVSEQNPKDYENRGILRAYWFSEKYEKVFCKSIPTFTLWGKDFYGSDYATYLEKEMRRFKSLGWGIKNTEEGIEFFKKMAIYRFSHTT